MEGQYILQGSDGKISLFQFHSETSFGAWHLQQLIGECDWSAKEIFQDEQPKLWKQYQAPDNVWEFLYCI